GSPKPAVEAVRAHAGAPAAAPLATDWADVPPSRFYEAPRENLVRLYRRYRAALAPAEPRSPFP
ncbi:MAG: hypothetical protein ACRDF0_05060, partial [Candidatus Limnocylindria bacterium]